VPERRILLDRLLSSRIFLWIVAVMISVGVWLYVSGGKGTEMVRTITCPVEYINTPFQSRLKNETELVDVQLSGERNILSELDTEKVRCQVDLKGLDPGKYSIAVRATVPRNIKLVDVIPSHAQVEIVRLLERDFRLDLDVKDGLPSGLYVDSVTITPPRVRISGEENDVSAIERVFVSPTLDQLKAGGDIQLAPEVLPSSINMEDIKITPSEVSVSAILAQGMPKKEVTVNARLTGNPHPDFKVGSVSVEPVSVKVEGPLKELEKIEKINTETFDISGLSSDQHVVLPLMPLPEGSLNYLSESSVSLRIDIKPFTVTKIFPKVPVVVEGRSVYPGWSVTPDEVEITLEGTASDFRALDETDDPVKAYVNVTNIVSKRLTVPVNVKAGIPGVKIIKTDPPNVQVSAQIN